MPRRRSLYYGTAAKLIDREVRMDEFCTSMLRPIIPLGLTWRPECPDGRAWQLSGTRGITAPPGSEHRDICEFRARQVSISGESFDTTLWGPQPDFSATMIDPGGEAEIYKRPEAYDPRYTPLTRDESSLQASHIKLARGNAGGSSPAAVTGKCWSSAWIPSSPNKRGYRTLRRLVSTARKG